MANFCKIAACILFSLWLLMLSFITVCAWEICSPFCFNHPGIVLVAVGVIGETLFENTKRLKKYFAWILIVGLLLEMREAVDADAKVEESKTNLASLNKATIELAHQYDLSTNALAEANARIVILNEELESVSPSNFPISSVSGFGYVVINKDDTSKIVGLEGKRAILELKPKLPTNALIRNPMVLGGVFVDGLIIGAWTNRVENTEISFFFDQSNIHRAGGGNVTFNNLEYARLDICPNGPSSTNIVRVESGYLHVELNSGFDFEADFKFPSQTNQVINIWALRNSSRFP